MRLRFPPSHSTWLGLACVSLFMSAMQAWAATPPQTRPAAGGLPATTRPADAVQGTMKYLYSLPRQGANPQAATAESVHASDPRWMAVIPSGELDQEFGGTRSTTSPAGRGGPGAGGAPGGVSPQADASRQQRSRPFPRDPRGRFVPRHRSWDFVGPPVPEGVILGPGVDGNVYRFGFTNEYDFGRFYTESNARTEMVLQHHAGHLTNALKLFRQRRYAEAADGFRLAADTNHGDPSSRLYSAHALFALGRYSEAVPYLRRAFELQPKIVFLNFDIRDDYGDQKDFQSQLAALESAMRQSPGNLDRMIVLGYVRYYSGQRPAAFDVLNQARQLSSHDPLIQQLLANSRPPDVLLDRR